MAKFLNIIIYWQRITHIRGYCRLMAKISQQQLICNKSSKQPTHRTTDRHFIDRQRDVVANRRFLHRRSFRETKYVSPV